MFKEHSTLPLDRIVPYEGNPRLNDEAVAFVYNSIRDFGYVSEIAVNQDGVILSGHTRHKALQKLYEDGEFEKGKLKEQGITFDAIPVKVVHFKDEKEESMYRLADNKVAEKSGWDFDKLDALLEDLKDDFDLEDYGFDFDLWGPGAVEEDEVVEKAKDPKGEEAKDAQEELPVYDPVSRVKPLDTVELGPHVLVCKCPTWSDMESLVIEDEPFCIASTGGRLEADDVMECVKGNAAFHSGNLRTEDERDFLAELTYGGQWRVCDFLHWERPTVDEPDGEHVSHAMDTVAIIGFRYPDPEVVGNGVCDEGSLADMYAWVIRACTSEGDCVVDLTGAERDLIAVCDALGRRCVCFCPDPAVCDCIVADYEDAHPKESVTIYADKP